MSYNINAGYGSLVGKSLTPATAWKTFYVTSAVWTGTASQFLQDVFTPDSDWVVRVYANITDALASCLAGRWDAIVIANDYTTAPTDTELSSAVQNE